MLNNLHKVTKNTSVSRRNSLVKDLDNIEYVNILLKYFNQHQVDLTFDAAGFEDPKTIDLEGMTSNVANSFGEIDSNDFNVSFEEEDGIDEINNLNNPYLESHMGDASSDYFLIDTDENDCEEQAFKSFDKIKLNYRCHADLNLKFNVNVIDRFSSNNSMHDDFEDCSSQNTGSSSDSISSLAESDATSASTPSSEKRFNYIFDDKNEKIKFFPKRASSLAAALIPDKFISSLVNSDDTYNTTLLI